MRLALIATILALLLPPRTSSASELHLLDTRLVLAQASVESGGAGTAVPFEGDPLARRESWGFRATVTAGLGGFLGLTAVTMTTAMLNAIAAKSGYRPFVTGAAAVVSICSLAALPALGTHLGALAGGFESSLGWMVLVNLLTTTGGVVAAAALENPTLAVVAIIALPVAVPLLVAYLTRRPRGEVALPAVESRPSEQDDDGLKRDDGEGDSEDADDYVRALPVPNPFRPQAPRAITFPALALRF